MSVIVQRGYSCAIKHVYGIHDGEYGYGPATTKQQIADAIEPHKDGFNLTAITCQEPQLEKYLTELGFERIAEMPKCSMYGNGPDRKPLTLWLRKCPLPMWGEKKKPERTPEQTKAQAPEQIQAQVYAIYDHWGQRRPGESDKDYRERAAREQEEKRKNYKPIANYHDSARW